jgi:hypothetical protein
MFLLQKNKAVNPFHVFISSPISFPTVPAKSLWFQEDILKLRQNQ